MKPNRITKTPFENFCLKWNILKQICLFYLLFCLRALNYLFLHHFFKIMKDSLLLSIAEKVGSPTYVYDAEKIQSQYNRLEKAFQGIEKLRINYACKALSNISILSLMKSMGSGLDTVSVQEVHLGIQAGFEPKDIIFTPNGVSLAEIEEVAEMGVQINIGDAYGKGHFVKAG